MKRSPGPIALLAVDDEQHRVGALELVLDPALHALGEHVARALDPGQVDEHQLPAPGEIGGDPAARAAGGLRAVGDDRHLGADDRVDERRLADVRAPGEADEAGAASRDGIAAAQRWHTCRRDPKAQGGDMRRATIATIRDGRWRGCVAATPAAANQPPAMEYDSYRMASTKTSLLVPSPGRARERQRPRRRPARRRALLQRPAVRDPGACGEPAASPTRPSPASAASTSSSYSARRQPATTSSPCCGHVYITVTRPPVAHDDSYGALTGVRRTVAAPGVLANDERRRVRPAGRPARPRAPSNLRRTGRFNYIADPGFVGTDTFTYEARRAAASTPSARHGDDARSRHRTQPPAPVADAYTTPEDSRCSSARPACSPTTSTPTATR